MANPLHPELDSDEQKEKKDSGALKTEGTEQDGESLEAIAAKVGSNSVSAGEGGEAYSDYEKELIKLVELTIAETASDLHLTVGYKPIIRVSGTLIPVTKKARISPKDGEGFLKALASAEQIAHFKEAQELDFSYSYKGDFARFRVNAAVQRGEIAIAMRLIPQKIRTLADLNLPLTLDQFTKMRQGFFLCVGPVGQGKSTTLAALIEQINLSRTEHIVTIEDPIEYIYTPKQSFISQREVHVDTHNFNDALVHSLRQDVNVILVGEMRDTETIASAVTASETGHLVFSSLHTNSASQTVDRIIDSFPAHQQDQIRVQLSAGLAGIFSQRLIPRVSGGRIPAYELMINNKATANLIRERRTHELNTVIETSSNEGMISMNASLADLVRKGEIAVEHAFQAAYDPKELERLL